MSHKVNRKVRARGFTLVELVVVISIIVVLIGLLVVGGGAVHKSMKVSRAKTQVQVLADAIDKYAQAWPEWKYVTNMISGAGVTVSRKGWPHWSSAFAFPTTGTNAFSAEVDFNDANGLSLIEPMNLGDDDTKNPSTGQFYRDDVRIVAECITLELTALSQGSAALRDASSFDMFVEDVKSGRLYPAPTSTGGANKGLRRRLLDPWGNPFRYLWLARDSGSASGWRAITSADYTQTANDPTTNGPRFAVAEGFVIESAGPDGLFGNRWRRLSNRATPTGAEQADIDSAEDNLIQMK